MRVRVGLAGALLAALLAPPAAGEGGAGKESAPPAVIGDVLGASPEGFAVVEGPRLFDFPADHGPHPEYRSEWWYFTGNVADPEGGAYGFQLTFFRFRLAAESGGAPLGVGGAAGVHGALRGHRRGGATIPRLRALQPRCPRPRGRRGGSLPGLARRLGARAGRTTPATWRCACGRARRGVGIDLAFGPGEGPVLHGDGGYSRKSAAPGNASYYYSYPRMPVSGRLWTPRGDFEVSGEGWLDREWSSSALASDQVGWDWFALRLSDGRALMLYQLRRRDGSADPFSYGMLAGAGGSTVRLGPESFAIEVMKHWQSVDKEVVYPSKWRLRVPSASLDLEVEPLLEDQEWRQAFRYWGGSGFGPGAVRDPCRYRQWATSSSRDTPDPAPCAGR